MTSIDVWDHETNCAAVFSEAGIDPMETPGAHGLALALMGRGWVSYEAHLPSGLGFYCPAGARERIYLRRGMTPFREEWVIYHELAERHLYASRDIEGRELACDQLASCLRAPREPFRALVRKVGLDLERLAEDALVSQTSAAMRFAETTGHPVAVVTPKTVHVRGEDFGWPDEPELRKLAKGRLLPPQLRRTTISDARGRVVLVAA